MERGVIFFKMTILKISSANSIKYTLNNKNGRYGQNSKPKGKAKDEPFEVLFEKELRRLKNENKI